MTKEDIDRVEQAAMLDAVARKIGLVVWDLQDLEWMLAQYAVMIRPGVRGMGMEAAAPVLEKAGKRTFGTLLRELVESKHLQPALSTRLVAIVDERNWIVHRSRRENRGIIHSRERCAGLLDRLQRAHDESADLRRHVVDLMERHAAASGVQQTLLDRETERLLKEWGFSTDL